MKWYYKNIHYVGLCDIECHLDQTINALIIEFFDSVGIYINISAIPFSKDFRVEIRSVDNSFLSSCDYEAFNSRTEATNTSIEKANELYNEAQ